MVIRCTLPAPFESILRYVKRISELPPLPGYITQRGPFINNGVGNKNRIIITYEFDEPRLAEAWDIISNQLDLVRDLLGSSFSAHCRIAFAEMKNRQSIRLKNRRLVTITQMRS